MVRYIGGGSFSEKTENGSVSYTEIACTSSDTKPTSGFATGSICVEVDTGSVFFFSEAAGEWVEQFSFQ